MFSWAFAGYVDATNWDPPSSKCEDCLLALQLVPSRESFLEKLGTPGQGMMDEMQQFITAFDGLLSQIWKFLADRGLDDPAKV